MNLKVVQIQVEKKPLWLLKWKSFRLKDPTIWVFHHRHCHGQPEFETENMHINELEIIKSTTEIVISTTKVLL